MSDNNFQAMFRDPRAAETALNSNDITIVDYGVVEISDLDQSILEIRDYPKSQGFSFLPTSQVMEMTVNASAKIVRQYGLLQERKYASRFGFTWGGIVGPSAADVQVTVTGIKFDSHGGARNCTIVYQWDLAE